MDDKCLRLAPRPWLFAGSLVALWAMCCATLTARERIEAPPPTVDGGHHYVGAEVPADASVEGFLAPLRAEMDKKVNDVIGEATAPLQKGGAESSLGNFVTDAMRAAASEALGSPVDIAVTNNGGLRASIAAGPITLRSIIEVMPFENRLMVVRLKGTQLTRLVEQIAARGGVPQSGLRLAIRSKAIDEVTVGDAPIDEERVYTVVTTDYLYNVGGKMSAFQQDPQPTDTGLVLRDVLVSAVRKAKTIAPRVDGRTVRKRGGSR